MARIPGETPQVRLTQENTKLLKELVKQTKRTLVDEVNLILNRALRHRDPSVTRDMAQKTYGIQQ